MVTMYAENGWFKLGKNLFHAIISVIAVVVRSNIAKNDNYIFFSWLSAFTEMNYIPWLPMNIPCEEDHLIHLFSMLRSL